MSLIGGPLIRMQVGRFLATLKRLAEAEKLGAVPSAR